LENSRGLPDATDTVTRQAFTFFSTDSPWVEEGSPSAGTAVPFCTRTGDRRSNLKTANDRDAEPKHDETHRRTIQNDPHGLGPWSATPPECFGLGSDSVFFRSLSSHTPLLILYRTPKCAQKLKTCEKKARKRPIFRRPRAPNAAKPPKKLSKYDIRYRVCNSSESTRGSTLTQNFTDMASLRSPTEVGEDGTDFSMLSDLAFSRSIPESNLGRSACYPAFGPPFTAKVAHTFSCFLTRNFSKSFRGLDFFPSLGPFRTRCRVGRHSFL
jgi:hypothetical protein